MRNVPTKSAPVLATATALVLLAGANAASASTPTGATPAPQAHAAAPATPVSAALANGARAYVDPKTHKLRQANEEERAAEAQSAALTPAPKFNITRMANGGLRAEDVSGSLMEEVDATRNPDGSVTLSIDGDTAPVSQPAAKLEEK